MKALTAVVTLLLGTSASAIEAQNPLFLCERFIEGPERTDCQKRMEKLKPDWYLATVCNKNFDDQLFYNCTQLTELGAFTPDKLNTCASDELSDSARIQCVKSALTQSEKAFQTSKPKPAIQKK